MFETATSMEGGGAKGARRRLVLWEKVGEKTVRVNEARGEEQKTEGATKSSLKKKPGGASHCFSGGGGTIGRPRIPNCEKTKGKKYFGEFRKRRIG